MFATAQAKARGMHCHKIGQNQYRRSNREISAMRKSTGRYEPMLSFSQEPNRALIPRMCLSVKKRISDGWLHRRPLLRETVKALCKAPAIQQALAGSIRSLRSVLSSF